MPLLLIGALVGGGAVWSITSVQTSTKLLIVAAVGVWLFLRLKRG